MKIIYLSILISYPAVAQVTDIRTIRELYYKSADCSTCSNKLFQQLGAVTEEIPVLFGYKGMAELMICYHSFNPYTKLSYFYKGKAKLETALSKKPTEPELHYLRFAVQCNAPIFLGYDGNIAEDKDILVQYLLGGENKQKDQDLYNRVKEFMLHCKQCRPEELNKLKTL
jgi:hypothetical protein